MVWQRDLGFNLSQICPGDTPGKTTIRMTDYRRQLPARAPQQKSDVAFFTIACEDMPLMDKVYNSFANSRSATTVFGRNEPCLTYQHHCYLVRRPLIACPARVAPAVPARRNPSHLAQPHRPAPLRHLPSSRLWRTGRSTRPTCCGAAPAGRSCERVQTTLM